MKLSRALRHEIYKKTLARVRRNGWCGAGICYHIDGVCERIKIPIANYETMLEDHFPEVWNQRPANYDGRFFTEKRKNGKDEYRENILRQCIRETSPKKKSKK